MKWPLKKPAVPRSQTPLYNLYYLHAPGADHADPTILWGTDVDVEELQEFLHERNQSSPVLISLSHVLLQATARCLAQHPHLNRRVVGRRVFAFREINLRMAFHNPRSGEVDVILVRRADESTLEQIAGTVWQTLLTCSQGLAAVHRDRRRMKALPACVFHALLSIYRWFDRHWALPTFFRLDDIRCSAVLVNDLSFRGAPPMRTYKPTRFPDESATLNVTLGPMEEKVVVRDGQPVASTVAPLFVRADHRIVDAYQLGRFVGTLRDLLQHPAQLDLRFCGSSALAAGDARNRCVLLPAATSRKTA